MPETDGDTIRSMRIASSACALALVCACSGNPTLTVDVVHPSGLAVATTDVAVYESPTLACTDVEFGRLNALQLQALQTADETIASGGAVTGSLDGISRANNKIVVARGYDSTGDLIAAGCAQVGVVSGNQTVTITTEVAATVAIDPPGTSVTAGSDGTATVVTATDPSGNLIDGRPISWTVYGPAGSTPATMTNVTIASDGVWQPAMPTCTSDGIAQIHVAPPSAVAGYAVQMQVAWASGDVPIFTELNSASLGLSALTPPSYMAKFCAIRHSGSDERLDCMSGSDDSVTDYAIAVDATGSASLSPVSTQSWSLGTTPMALLSVPDPSGGLDTYVFDDQAHLTALFGAPAAAGSGDNCPLDKPNCAIDAVVAPPCGSTPGRIFYHIINLNLTESIRTLDYSGAYTGDISYTGGLPALDTAGCLAQLGGSDSPVQAASILTTSSATAGTGSGSDSVDIVRNPHVQICTASGCAEHPFDLGKSSTIGFTGGVEPRMVTTSVDATGVVLLQVVLSPSSTLIERTTMPTASVPDHILAGQFDADTDVDLVWDFSSKQGTNVEVAYARQVGDEPLEALSPTTSATIEAVLVGDLNGDGLDDIVALGSGGGSAEVTGAAIVPMGVPVATAVATDPTCSP